LRRKYGGAGVSDEDLLLRFFSSKEDVERMRAAGPPRTYNTEGNPLLNLVAELSKQKDRGSVFIRRAGFSLHLQRRSV
jgi:oxaloacetate decarboxylase alpha subunit